MHSDIASIITKIGNYIINFKIVIQGKCKIKQNELYAKLNPFFKEKKLRIEKRILMARRLK